MLYLFRKIRKSLLKKGKLWNYLLYALGEIILVVLGILIALQIDNANEEKQSRAFEREILDQVFVNLQKDKDNLDRIKGNFEKAIISSDKILAAMQQPEIHDSTKFWLADVVQFDRFQPLTNAYEQLKSRGFDHIKNRDLRFMLGTYYDDIAKHTIKSIEDIEYAFNSEWVPVIKEEVVHFTFKQEVILEDFKVLDENRPAGKILKLNRDNYRGGIFRISIALNTIEELLDKIQAEVDS